MLCPICKSILINGSNEVFETLLEHVECVEHIDARPTFTCPNVKCVASNDGVFWNEYGEGPYKLNRDHKYDWIDNNYAPFDSWQRGSNFSIGYHDEDRKFKFGKFMVIRRVTYKSNDHGDKVGRQVKYDLYINNMHYTSGLSMLIYSLRMLFRLKGEERKRKAIEFGKQAKWPRAEWWRKVAAWIAKYI